jgi:DNA adenine methylase
MKPRTLLSREDSISNGSAINSKYSRENSAAIKPLFSYFGSKHRIASRIAEMLPKHNAWVEAFCGSAAVTLAKAPAQIEIINDKDGDIVNLFRVLRKDPERLGRLIEFTPYAREEFELSRNGEVPLDEFERARRFLVASNMTVNGTGGSKNSGFSHTDSFARGDREARVNRWCQLPSRIQSVVDRLKFVRVENRDAIELLEDFQDRPATLMYLDPPYLMDRSHTYKVDANDKEFHTRLLEAACESRCMVLISCYDNPLYSEMLKTRDGWTRTEIETSTRAVQGKDMHRVEVLWMNEQFSRARINNRVPIRLSRKEKLERKVNPQRA